jgi:hypothetical protein
VSSLAPFVKKMYCGQNPAGRVLLLDNTVELSYETDHSPHLSSAVLRRTRIDMLLRLLLPAWPWK